MKSIQIDIPDWTAEQIASKSRELGISAGELMRAIVCSSARTYEPDAARHFTVPASMAGLFPSERYMVIGRDADGITLTPTDYVPFEEALEAFRANGLTEEQVLEISAT